MSKSAEVEKLARLALSRQAETDMRVEAVETGVKAAADAAAAADGGRAVPVAAPSLDGLYGWRPEAFSVWFTTGGGGKVGVSFPEKCVSYNGNHMADDVLTPSVQEDPETKFRWCELEAPSEGAPKLVLTLLVELDGVTHEPGDTVTVAYLEWAASVDDAKARHEETDRKVVACVPIAEYDAKLDRLSQVHVGALALGGGGGGGGSVDADDISVGFDGGKLEIHDFHDSTKSVDDKTLAQRLAEDRMPAATEYQLLARAPGKPNSLGYVPLGSLEPPYKPGEGIHISGRESDGKYTISVDPESGVIPAVNDAKLTIKQGASDTSPVEFTANAADDKTVVIPQPDGSSLEKTSSGAVQLKDWTGTGGSTSLAADLAGDPASSDLVLVRKTANGGGSVLDYKPIGTISGGIDSNVKITKSGNILLIDVYYL